MSPFSFSGMPRKRVLIWLLGIAGALVVVSLVVNSLVQIKPLTVGGLKTNNSLSPLGIPGLAPTFSWQSEASARGTTQTAYEVRVASSQDKLDSADVWRPGRSESPEQLNVKYAGPELSSEHRYYWQVRIWDSNGQASNWSDPAWFETALPAAGGWDAQWVGGDDPAKEMAKWRDYTVSIDFTLEKVALGVYLRSKDVNNGYMWQITVADGTPKLRAHKKQYSAYSVLRDKDISSFVSVASLQRDKHKLVVTAKGNDFSTSLDGVVVDHFVDDSFGEGFVGFRQAVLDQGPEISSVQKVVVTAADGSKLLDSDLSTQKSPFDGVGIVNGSLRLVAPVDTLYNPNPSLPLLRKEFEAKGGVKSARLYATARGVYQIKINGHEVGDAQLAPGWTDYAKRLDYQTYDVGSLIQAGANVVSAMLGDGWYSGNIGGFGSGNYGTRPSLLAQLRIEFEDGTQATVGTDSSWRFVSGPIVQADLIMGETFDERRLPQDWERPGFSSADLRDAQIVDPPIGASLEPQTGPPVQVVQTLAAVGRTESKPGTWIYDMGQNMVGVLAVALRGKPGQTVQIRYGEMLNKDGTLYTANLRSAKATDSYTFGAGGVVNYSPRFTFHGFRYAEITGVDNPPGPDEVSGRVFSSGVTPTGTFSTSSDMLNKLQSNIRWSQQGNFLSIPMDTPARDERLGWTGDINVFAPTASFNADTRGFLEKWLRDLRDAQLPNGDFPGIAPSICGCFQGGAGWSDASIMVPFSLWRAYGDLQVVRDNYTMMKNFIQFRMKSASPAGVVVHGPYGDWLNLDDPTDPGLIGTAYFAYTARLLSAMASAIGETQDGAAYAQLADTAKADFVRNFVKKDGTLNSQSQAAYAISIGMELMPAELTRAAGDRLVSLIEVRGGHLSTGFLGTPWLLQALSSTGHIDVAFGMLTETSYPSWGYEVAQGATTMWERWDGVKPNGDLGDPRLNSYNHYAYGAVGDWMYRNIAGISPTLPGYKGFVIAPQIGGGLTHAEGSFDSVYGRIASSWRLEDSGLALDVTVPMNTTATVHIPAPNSGRITVDGIELSKAKGITSIAEGDGTVVLELGSGEYRFKVGK